VPLTPGGGALQIPENSTVDNAAIQAINTTPALQQLHEAFQKGLVTAAQMQQLFSTAAEQPKKNQLNNEEIQASKARASLIPAQTELTANKLNVENSLIQPRANVERGALGITEAGQGGILPETEFTASEAKQDPTGSLQETRKNFQALHLGNILRQPDGTPDYEAMGAANERLAQLRMGQIILPTQKEILDQLKERSPEDSAQAYDAQGNLKPTAELAKILANSKPKLNAAEVQSSTSAVIGADAGLSNIERARGILKSDPNAVGPKWTQGSKVGSLLAQGKALIGNEAATKRFDNQKNLNVTLAQGILDSIRSLRGTGAIRNTEIQAIERGQPQPDSSVSQWTNWLNQSENLLQRAQRAQKLGLGPQTNAAIQPTIHDEPAAGPIEPNAPAPVTAPAGNLKTVSTQEDYDAIPVGGSYIFNNKVYPKVQ